MTSAESSNTLSLKKVKSFNDTLDKAEMKSFIAYPNPVKLGSVINILTNDDLPFDVFIVNVNGETVFSKLNNKDVFLRYN